MTERRALGAQLVVERIHLGVVLLADVAGTRFQQGARDRSLARGRERDPSGLVVDTVGSARCRRRHDVAVGLGDELAFREPPLFLDRLEHPGGRPSHRDEVRMLVIEFVQRAQHLESDPELLGVDAARGRVRSHIRF